MGDGGKGSGRRPMEVPIEVFEDNWDRIFGKKEKNVEPKGCQNEGCFCTGECKEPKDHEDLKVN